MSVPGPRPPRPEPLPGPEPPEEPEPGLPPDEPSPPPPRPGEPLPRQARKCIRTPAPAHGRGRGDVSRGGFDGHVARGGESCVCAMS